MVSFCDTHTVKGDGGFIAGNVVFAVFDDTKRSASCARGLMDWRDVSHLSVVLFALSCAVTDGYSGTRGPQRPREAQRRATSVESATAALFTFEHERAFKFERCNWPGTYWDGERQRQLAPICMAADLH